MYLLNIEKRFQENKGVPEYQEFETWPEMTRYIFDHAMFIKNYEIKEVKDLDPPKEKFNPLKIYVSHSYI